MSRASRCANDASRLARLTSIDPHDASSSPPPPPPAAGGLRPPRSSSRWSSSSVTLPAARSVPGDICPDASPPPPPPVPLPPPSLGVGARARFRNPGGVALAPGARALVVADATNNRVRRVDLATGRVTTVAGSDYAPRHSLTPREREAGLRDGPAERARFWFPRDVAVAADGTIYVADSHNHAVRAISARSPRVVTTLAGSGACACLDGRGPHAAFRRPQGLHLDEREALLKRERLGRAQHRVLVKVVRRHL